MARTERIQQAETPSDFALHNHGTLFILVPLSGDAETWCEDHLQQDGMRWAGGYAVDHRCMQDIIEGIREGGLTLCAA